MNKKILKTLLILGVIGLSSCETNNVSASSKPSVGESTTDKTSNTLPSDSAIPSIVPSTSMDDTPSNSEQTKDNETKHTDSLRFNNEYVGKNFLIDGIGEATYRSHVDGDITSFYIGDDDSKEAINVRYLGVDTPKSTGIVEPWGIEASEFTQRIVSTAKLIVLENDYDTFDKVDSTGNRYFGFVWYSMDGNPSNLRLLNLELVELGFSRNHFQVDSTKCPYRSYFIEAENDAKSKGLRIFEGVNDSDVAEISIFELRRNSEKYLASADGGTSTRRQLRIKALVVGMIGDNLILRDLERDLNQKGSDMLEGIYAYAGYNSMLLNTVKVGDVVRFYCYASIIKGALQLSDLNENSIKKPFEIFREYRDSNGNPSIEKVRNDYPEADDQPYEMDTSTFDASLKNNTRYGDFKDYDGKLVKTRITVRLIENGDYDEYGDIISGSDVSSYYKEDANGNYICYANSKARYYSNTEGEKYLTLTLRVDGTQYPHVYPSYFVPGHTYECYGYLSTFFGESYQLMLLNNTQSYYIVDVTD